MTQSIQEGLDRLYTEIIPLSKQFREEDYENIFLDKYNEYKPLFEEIISACEDAEDKDAAIKEYASYIPDKVHAVLDQYQGKRKKESALLPYNLGMSTYIIPMLRYMKSETAEELVDQMIVFYNQNEVPLDIKKSTFESIKEGFKAHLCYITTAVCESLGKGDNCYELNVLRDYRDNYLLNTADGKSLVDNYYDIAPTIVRRIDKCQDSDSIYADLWKSYINPCIKLIEDNRKEECTDLYKDMVIDLQKKYLYS